jgi:hypothetical protein
MNAPIRIWEFDYSGIKKEIDDLKEQGISDFKQFFDEHPEFLIELAGLVKINVLTEWLSRYIPDQAGKDHFLAPDFPGRFIFFLDTGNIDYR